MLGKVMLCISGWPQTQHFTYLCLLSAQATAPSVNFNFMLFFFVLNSLLPQSQPVKNTETHFSLRVV